MEQVATLLRQARENRNIGLKEAEAATRIPVRYLQILEGGETHLLSDRAYVIPHLRRYATFLELDVPSVVNQFATEQLHATQIAGIIQAEREAESRSSWTIPIISLLVLVGVFAVASQQGVLNPFSSFTTQEESPPVALSPFEPPLEEAPPESAAPSPPAIPPSDAPTPSPPNEPVVSAPPQPVSPPPAAPPAPPSAPTSVPTSHSLKLQAKEETWLRIVIDGQAKEIILRPGQQAEWTAQQGFLLTLGNAGGVDVTLNGKALPALGKPGQVLRNLRLPASADAPSSASTRPSSTP